MKLSECELNLPVLREVLHPGGGGLHAVPALLAPVLAPQRRGHHRQVLGEVWFGEDGARAGHGAAHQVRVLQPQPARQRAGVGAAYGDPGTRQTVLLGGGIRA